MKSKSILLTVITVLLFGCSDGEEGLKEQTVIQTKEQINAQNENQKKWALKLESDLDKRRSFIGAIEGEYEGEFDVKESTYNIRLMITPTIPDYNSNRDRTLAELEFELQNLNLNIQILQWNPNSNLSAVGCILENIRPDYSKGIINLITKNCNNTYELFLSDGSLTNFSAIKKSELINHSSKLAKEIRDGAINYIQDLNGKLRSSTNASIFTFSLKRI